MSGGDGEDSVWTPAFGIVTFTDDTTIPGETYLYSVSSIDAFWNESSPSPEITVSVPSP